jgi:hypothetical protein
VPIVLQALSFHGDDGDERTLFHNGESLRVRVHYTANDSVRGPICELQVERHDGTHVTTTSNRTGGHGFGEVWKGTGYFEWRVEDLRLTPGSYSFTPRIYDETGLHLLDEHVRWATIRVHEGAYAERGGTVVLPAAWGHEEVSTAVPTEPWEDVYGWHPGVRPVPADGAQPPPVTPARGVSSRSGGAADG